MSVRPHPKQGTDPDYAQAWIIDYYPERGHRVKKIVRGITEAQARIFERRLRAELKGRPITQFPSLMEAAPHFMAYYAMDHQPAGTVRMQWSMKQVLRFFGRYQFTSLTPAIINEYKRARLEQVSHSTINKELAALSSFCKWGEEMGYCQEIRIKRFAPKLTRAPIPDVPSREEMVRILRAIPRKKRAIFALMYYLGLRSSEARSVTPRMVMGGVLVVTGKGNKQRVVPISRRALPYLRNSIPVQAPKDLREILLWACRRVGIDRHVYPHLFRHAFGRMAIEAGVNLRSLQQVLGHSSSATTELYSRMAAEALTKEIDKMWRPTVVPAGGKE